MNVEPLFPAMFCEQTFLFRPAARVVAAWVVAARLFISIYVPPGCLRCCLGRCCLKRCCAAIYIYLCSARLPPLLPGSLLRGYIYSGCLRCCAAPLLHINEPTIQTSTSSSNGFH